MASSARRALRLTVFVLLSLVALDLTSPSLCALDNPESAPATLASIDGDSKDAETPRPPAHVDDCFCCSHCVHPTVTLEPLGLTLVRGRLSSPLTDGHFAALGAPFHPPRS